MKKVENEVIEPGILLKNRRSNRIGRAQAAATDPTKLKRVPKGSIAILVEPEGKGSKPIPVIWRLENLVRERRWTGRPVYGGQSADLLKHIRLGNDPRSGGMGGD